MPARRDHLRRRQPVQGGLRLHRPHTAVRRPADPRRPARVHGRQLLVRLAGQALLPGRVPAAARRRHQGEPGALPRRRADRDRTVRQGRRQGRARLPERPGALVPEPRRADQPAGQALPHAVHQHLARRERRRLPGPAGHRRDAARRRLPDVRVPRLRGGGRRGGLHGRPGPDDRHGQRRVRHRQADLQPARRHTRLPRVEDLRRRGRQHLARPEQRRWRGRVHLGRPGQRRRRLPVGARDSAHLAARRLQVVALQARRAAEGPRRSGDRHDDDRHQGRRAEPGRPADRLRRRADDPRDRAERDARVDRQGARLHPRRQDPHHPLRGERHDHHEHRPPGGEARRVQGRDPAGLGADHADGDGHRRRRREGHGDGHAARARSAP